MDGDRRIGSYKVVRLLGKGGMSEVYEVENPRLGSRHALKLYTYSNEDADVKERFLVEGRLLAKLCHPRIVRVVDFGNDGEQGRPYFVMDLLANERGAIQPLSEVEPGTVDEETVGRWYDDIREGLAYIHSNGIVHRDLKLQNVMIGPDGHAVLTDFGISKVFDVNGDGKQVVDTVQTLVKCRDGRSLVMGSVGYMAPELEMGAAASPQSDYYALGVIIYRLLTGTWCDARTDVVEALETYDPVWKRILPRLLHSNPNGRECLSFEAERRADRERAEAELNEQWLKEKGRGHRARHVARYVAVVAALFGALILWRETDRAKVVAQLQARLDIPDFATTCVLPPSTGGAESSGAALYDPRLALVDAWVLTHGVFDDLKAGKITCEKAVDELASLCDAVRENRMGLFEGAGGYVPSGDSAVLQRILANALESLEKRLDERKGAK